MPVVRVAEGNLVFTGGAPQPDHAVAVQVSLLDLIRVCPFRCGDAHGHCSAHSGIIDHTPIDVSLRDRAQRLACNLRWMILSCGYVNGFRVCSAALALKNQTGTARRQPHGRAVLSAHEKEKDRPGSVQSATPASPQRSE